MPQLEDEMFQPSAAILIIGDEILSGRTQDTNSNFLAKKLTDMHEWSDMAKFCRTGGEANAVAVRLARAYTGKEKVAICGYHGWHDWYLASNLNNKKNLDSHLYQNLKIKSLF